MSTAVVGETDVAAGGGGGGAGGEGAALPVPAQIAGISELKGLVLYGATLTFAGLYAYFAIRIFGADAGKPPNLNATEVAVAAALAGVLGSAFALEIGRPTENRPTNPGLRDLLAKAEDDPKRGRTYRALRKALSLEPADATKPSWPKTFGIWVYAAVAGIVTLTYVINQPESPEKFKVLAAAFAGYVLSLLYNAYGITPKK